MSAPTNFYTGVGVLDLTGLFRAFTTTPPAAATNLVWGATDLSGVFNRTSGTWDQLSGVSTKYYAGTTDLALVFQSAHFTGISLFPTGLSAAGSHASTITTPAASLIGTTNGTGLTYGWFLSAGSATIQINSSGAASTTFTYPANGIGGPGTLNGTYNCILTDAYNHVITGQKVTVSFVLS